MRPAAIAAAFYYLSALVVLLVGEVASLLLIGEVASLVGETAEFSLPCFTGLLLFLVGLFFLYALIPSYGFYNGQSDLLGLICC